MVNRKMKLAGLLHELWSRDLKKSDVLHYTSLMGFSHCVVEPVWEAEFERFDAQYDAWLALGCPDISASSF